jgi:hypothetical protein
VLPSALTRGAALCLILLGAGGTALAQEQDAAGLVVPTYVPHPHRQMRDHYVWGTFGPPGLMGAAITAGLQQWRDVPKEWGQSDRGFSKRFAAAYAESAIGDTTKYAISRLRDEDPSFRPCDCHGFHRRFTHAVIAPFTARKPDGRIVFSFARISAMTASSVVPAAAWSPTPQSAEGHIKHLGVGLAGTIGVDLLREFFLHHRTPALPAPAPRGD